MRLEELLNLAAQDEPTELEYARARRAMRRVAEDHRERLRNHQEIVSDVDLRDPLHDRTDEGRRIGRAAQLTKRGSITWDRPAGRFSWSDEMWRIVGLTPIEGRESVKQLVELIHPADRRTVLDRVRGAWKALAAIEFICR